MPSLLTHHAVCLVHPNTNTKFGEIFCEFQTRPFDNLSGKRVQNKCPELDDRNGDML